ncbi:ABC transporter permease [Nocardioides litoris]|uniref:ABC transporter permease n=1 Tax=Nocardioides litoris TaxID=1926648 RepID=UPI001FEA1E80|nr:ABC transporter permease [Nocardioides litoris]
MSAADLTTFGLGLAVVVATTVVVARWARVGLGWVPVTSILRATVQLGVVALLLQGVLAREGTVVLFLLLMASTASLTAAGRLRELWHGRRAAVAGVVSGAAVALGLVLALRLVELDARYVVAVAGIVIGNAMSAATLSGRTFLRSVRRRRDEVEGWLALGATPAVAHREIGREAVREALLPNLDQARSTGLVTLPGAFVGALFGGASPVEAARFQLVVLAGVALAMVVCGVVVTRLLGRTPYVVADESGD